MMLRVLLVPLVVLFAVAAYAGDKHETQLITPTLWAVSPDNLACNLTNTSQKERTVRVRIITNGNVLLDSGETTIEPMHTANHVVDGLEEGGPIYCEFTVLGSKSWYRGAAKLFRDHPNTTDFVVITAE